MILNSSQKSNEDSRLAKLPPTPTKHQYNLIEESIKKRSDINKPKDITIEDPILPDANCVKCPDTTPACKACPPGQVCLLSTQTCHSCANVSCIQAIVPIVPNSISPTSIETNIPSTTMSETPFPSLDEGPINSEHTTIKQRAVIGGTVGGIFFILFVVWFVIWLIRSRIRRYNPSYEKNNKNVNEKAIQSALHVANFNNPPPPVLQLGMNRNGNNIPYEQPQGEEGNKLMPMKTITSPDIPERYQRDQQNIAQKIKERTRRSIVQLLPDALSRNSNSESSKQGKDKSELKSNSQSLEKILSEQIDTSRVENTEPRSEIEGSTQEAYIDWRQAAADPPELSSTILVQPTPPKLPSLKLHQSTYSLSPSRFDSDSGSVRTSYFAKGSENRASIVSRATDRTSNNYITGIRPLYADQSTIKESSSSGSSSLQAAVPPIPTRASYIPIGYVGRGSKSNQRDADRYSKLLPDNQYGSSPKGLSFKRKSSAYNPPQSSSSGFGGSLLPLPEKSSRRISSATSTRNYTQTSESSPELSYPERVAGHDLSSSNRYTRYLERESQTPGLNVDIGSTIDKTPRERLYEAAARFSKSRFADEEPDRFLTPRLLASTSNLQTQSSKPRTPGHSIIRPLSIERWRRSHIGNTGDNSDDNKNNSSNNNSNNSDNSDKSKNNNDNNNDNDNNNQFQQDMLERDSFEYPVLFDNEPGITLVRSRSSSRE